jgi:hypothetical protein
MAQRVTFSEFYKRSGQSVILMNSIDITSFRTGRNTLTVRQLASEHIADIDAKIRRFRSLRNELRNLLSRRAAARSDELCPLISPNAQ